jgi:23S rRNA pseudouridine2605 synthase
MTRSRSTSRAKSGSRSGSSSDSNSDSGAEGERIAKVLARAGIASRRGAEALIAQGRVSVDGVVLKSPAFNVVPGQDIRVDGEPLPAAEPVRLFRYHKPAGLLVTRSDPQGRPTIFERLPPDLPRLVSVGRLDFNSEGLLLLTTDGGLARTLELPSTGWTRRYRARAHGRTTQAKLDTLAKGITIDGERFGPIHAKLEGEPRGANVWITVAIKEGRYREVRRALETLGLEVNRLIRTAYGPFQLGALKRGEIAEIPAKMLREQLGAKLAP